MPSHCCVPLCSQQGYRLSNGEKVSYFNFPKDKTARKQWIHAIRRDEGNYFKIHDKTKVCSLHFKPDDLKKSLNGRIFVKEGNIPSKFEWKLESPKKRKAPTFRQPLVKNTTCNNVPSTSSHADFTVSKVNDNEELLKEEVTDLKRVQEVLERTIKHTEDSLRDAKETISNLQQENCDLKKSICLIQEESVQNSGHMKKQIEILKKQSEIIEPLLNLNSLTSDQDIAFYTGFPNYDIFIALFNYLNPGTHGENIRYVREKPNDFYVAIDDGEPEKENGERKKGRPKKLKPIEEYFMVLCRLRRGFSIQHLSHLFGVASSSVSRSLTAWINFMYLKFGQINLWPSKQLVQDTMPDVFKEKYPNTRVIIDCTEIRCEMPGSLLLNGELFSSYKNHTTLKGLIGIAPSGAITFISQLYTGSISDREIVIRSGFLDQAFVDGDTVMADKGFTIQDLLPLGTTLNIPPFLGQNSQMGAEDVIRTQQIASVRIHVERAINRIKNYKIWSGVVPLSSFGLVNQMWSICAFLCNAQDKLISI
jgi:hypothetical protein